MTAQPSYANWKNFDAPRCFEVDAAVTVIATGATFFAGLPFWRHAVRALRPTSDDIPR